MSFFLPIADSWERKHPQVQILQRYHGEILSKEQWKSGRSENTHREKHPDPDLQPFQGHLHPQAQAGESRLLWVRLYYAVHLWNTGRYDAWPQTVEAQYKGKALAVKC